ncbi:inducible metalloproteinase inhibitor protein-like [Danaus plexippus]|uniref:inducible metalloproteinase inhibitor protein-like n=1 Tax=Danaus plexippus TaxID=13037 RepID=UPI002AB22FA7|nr:inducible metalloproteinase inhibitor protein-like [Danaus plexippus]
MARSLVLLVLCLSIVSCYDEVEDICGPNEHLKDGISCKSDCCPGEDCPDPCASACTCDLQYHRVSNGTCIPTRKCPPIDCPNNEHFDVCPVCNEGCDNAVASGKRCRFVGRIGITVICEPACRCDDGYWRNSKKQCVPYEECPQVQEECN